MTPLLLLVAMLPALSHCRTMIFNPSSSNGNPDFSSTANWNGSLPLLPADDVVIQITACQVLPAPGTAYAVISRSVTVNSLTLDSQVGATACPSSLIINSTGSLVVAGQVAVLPQSKIALNGGSITCATLVVQGDGVIGGSGMITALLKVDLWALSRIMPGVFFDGSCNNCWPQWGGQPSRYGDLNFVTPTTNAAFQSVFYFKDLSNPVQMSTRTRPGLDYDTVTFTGTLNSYGAGIILIHSNNSVFPDGAFIAQVSLPLYSTTAQLFQWGAVNLVQPFTMNNFLIGQRILRCNNGFNLHLGALASFWVCPNVSRISFVATIY
jgi:hypothetical protein